MQCIITALKAESDLLIQYFGLTKDYSFNFPFFMNKESKICLVGVGVGKKNLYSRIHTVFNSIENKNTQFINFGIAGGSKNSTQIGNLYIINKIIDEQSKKSFYPEILIKHNMDEREIITVQNEVRFDDGKYNSLVDMEASEIFNICSKIVPLQNLAFIKVVSDYMDISSKNFNNKIIHDLIKPLITELDNFLRKFFCLKKINRSILTVTDMNWVQFNSELLLLTKTQINELIRKTKLFRINHPNSSLPKINSSIPKNKIERNKFFNYVCAKLIT